MAETVPSDSAERDDLPDSDDGDQDESSSSVVDSDDSSGDEESSICSSADTGSTQSENDIVSNVKDSIRSVLELIEASGSFAHFEFVENPCNPGLMIDGYGAVGLPLSERDADRLKEQSERRLSRSQSQSPSSTSLDNFTSLEINPTGVRFGNPAWKVYLQGLIDHIEHELGLTCTFKAVLRCLSLQGRQSPGPVQPSVPVLERSFGVMLVTLPSAHKGGTIVVKRNLKEQKMESSQYSAYGSLCAAWYNDTEHEIDVVTSGHRLVLTYNLVQTDPGALPTASTLECNISSIRNCLRAWKADLLSCPQVLAFCLRDQYDDFENIDSLANEDEARVRCLIQACAEEGIEIFLWQIGKKDTTVVTRRRS